MCWVSGCPIRRIPRLEFPLAKRRGDEHPTCRDQTATLLRLDQPLILARAPHLCNLVRHALGTQRSGRLWRRSSLRLDAHPATRFARRPPREPALPQGVATIRPRRSVASRTYTTIASEIPGPRPQVLYAISRIYSILAFSHMVEPSGAGWPAVEGSSSYFDFSRSGSPCVLFACRLSPAS